MSDQTSDGNPSENTDSFYEIITHGLLGDDVSDAQAEHLAHLAHQFEQLDEQLSGQEYGAWLEMEEPDVWDGESTRHPHYAREYNEMTLHLEGPFFDDHRKVIALSRIEGDTRSEAEILAGLVAAIRSHLPSIVRADENDPRLAEDIRDIRRCLVACQRRLSDLVDAEELLRLILTTRAGEPYADLFAPSSPEQMVRDAGRIGDHRPPIKIVAAAARAARAIQDNFFMEEERFYGERMQARMEAWLDEEVGPGNRERLIDRATPGPLFHDVPGF